MCILSHGEPGWQRSLHDLRSTTSIIIIEYFLSKIENVTLLQLLNNLFAYKYDFIIETWKQVNMIK